MDVSMWGRKVHIIYYTVQGQKEPIVIPEYDEIDVEIIKNNMRTAGMSREEYFKLLKKIKSWLSLEGDSFKGVSLFCPFPIQTQFFLYHQNWFQAKV